ncbi:MAG: glycoside hydrolase family 2 protein [Candidatus Bipolaricaulia bacterium]
MKNIDLNGRWKFKSADGSKWMDARVPGDVYTDLFENGEIPDPFVGKNESDIQWVARTNWVYKKEFEPKGEFLSREKQVLDFKGLDTVAEISLNGRKVGEAKNAHRRYEYDVSDHLQRGRNVLKVLFQSPVEYGLEQREKYKYDISPHRYPVDQPGREFVRKPQCHFGWDWGPSLPTMGIYRDAGLAGFSGPRIRYLKTEQKFHGEDVLLKVWVGLEVPVSGNYEFKIDIGEEKTADRINLTPGRTEVIEEVKLEKPDLWWPVGYGEQPLYELEVGIGDDKQGRSLGFRRLELVREEDSKGESFYFKVNGTPIYAKGANTIPVDALPGRITEDRYARLIDSAVSANMNTLRVWGGGIYESDEFYELCDRKGIMVWQDFGFACSPYPANKDFLENVKKEVKYQARRLGSHPSLALWCGDNENEWLGKQGDYDTENHSWEEIVDDYSRLNETIRRTVKEEDPGRPFWPSSPSSDGKSNPNDQSIGDTHYWDVWHGGKPFSDYLTTKPRFVSEFGYQSFSSEEVLRKVVSEEELNPTAPELEYRQRHPRGNKLIVRRMTDNFRFPFSFEDFIYLSQIQQGLAMKTAIEHWRRLKPHCMGTLYWQLNDVWPAISWSSLEYGGGWKALHYFAKRFYSPVLVSTIEKQQNLEIWLTSDVDKRIGGTLQLSVVNLEGKEINSEFIELDIPELASEKVMESPLEEVLRGKDRENLILKVAFKSRDYQSDNYHFFTPFKSLNLKQPEVSYSLSDGNLNVRTERPALFVKLDSKREKYNGRFTENYFQLLPGQKKKLAVLSSDEGDPIRFDESDIRIKHLWDTYN